MHRRLAKRHGQGRTSSQDSPVRGCIQALPPDVGALNLRAKEMNHGGDKLTTLDSIAAVRPDRLFGILVRHFLLRFRAFVQHMLYLASGITSGSPRIRSATSRSVKGMPTRA